MAFNVGGKPKVVLYVDTDEAGTPVELRHHFVEPSEAEVIEFNRRLVGYDDQPSDIADARLYLYDRCCIKVEGYELDGVDLWTVPDWKNRVPARHKLPVAAAFEPKYLMFRPQPVKAAPAAAEGGGEPPPFGKN